LEFITSSPFLLIVGTDDITNTNTVESLISISQQYPQLEIRAFINEYNNITFHPKYCWFKQAVGGTAIVGSGNLTQNGLRKNWEAFTVINLNRRQITDLENQWNVWIDANNRFIKKIDDPLVITRVAENNRIVQRNRNGIAGPVETIPRTQENRVDRNIREELFDDETEAWSFTRNSNILIAEIPKASTRWNQANFDKQSFTDFFGAIPGDNRLRLLFRGLGQDRQLHDTEVRQSVSVKSHNWRFELNLAKHIVYPRHGRPTGIFVQVSSRMFLYMLILPNDLGYNQIQELLTERSNATIRREIYSVEEIKQCCEDLPLWDYLR
jgi:hypothetical protein